MDQQFADELVQAVHALTSGPGAATADAIGSYLERQFSRQVSGNDLLPALETLARQGRIDSISAAPGPDGLPVRGYRPAP